MSANTRKTISKEKQEAIKQFLTSYSSTRTMSPSTPELELDANFSQILRKKREEQLEASKQRLLDSTTLSNKSHSLFETNASAQRIESNETTAERKDNFVELDNSMMFNKARNKLISNDLSGDEDSFLALERQCNMDDQRERLLNANDTLLFDVEPPSELWNQTLTIDKLDCSQDDETIEMSPVKYVGLMRPSTIIEETSSQMDVSSKNSSPSSSTAANKSSFHATASSVNESSTARQSSNKSCDAPNGSQKANNDLSSSLLNVSPLGTQNAKQSTKADRQRRGTFAFKRANYTFFPNETLDPINESDCLIEDENFSNTKLVRVLHVETPKNIKSKTPIKVKYETLKKDLLDFGTPSNKNLTTVTTNAVAEINAENIMDDDKDQFNNTLERVEYLLEKGKEMREETPASKRSSQHHSMLETPLFSCKRKRLLSEMASMEMLPLPKRGPLIDFSTPEITNVTKRVSKYAKK